MKKTVLIANRLNVLEYLESTTDVEIVKIFALKGSLLDKYVLDSGLNERLKIDVFTMSDKARINDDLKKMDFDVLLSNGCPFILPIKELKKDGRLFINIHPTLLPDLKGKTPLNGIFLTHRTSIGATMHYIDEGIDTGRIIFQKGIDLTPDIDQGLVYKISFDLEKEVFRNGWDLLRESNFTFAGKKQHGEGSYFNRIDSEQIINIASDTTDTIIDKVKSFNIRGQGTLLHLDRIVYRIYFAEKITNPYLIERYKETPPAEIAFTYDNKVVIKTKDGMIKLTDYEAMEA